MTSYTHALATVLLICGAIILIVDVGAELSTQADSETDDSLPVRIKWTAGWVALRYISIICSMLLALDVVF